MPNFTRFDVQQRYIILPICVVDTSGDRQNILALLDTGAPATEFSDEVLVQLGFLTQTQHATSLAFGLQTKKYGRIILPHIEICSHTMSNLEVYVSHFDTSWDVRALIGLDFFRRFKVTVDYRAGHLITESYAVV